MLPHLAVASDLWVGYASDALGLRPVADDDGRASGSVVPDSLRGEAVLGVGLFDVMELAVGVPVAFALGGGAYGVAGRSSADLTGFAPGDIRMLLLTDLSFIDALREELPSSVRAGAGLTVWAPAGDTVRFEGEGAWRFEPRVFADWGHELGFRVALNLAYHVRPESKVFSFVNNDTLRYSIAASTPTGLHALEVVGSIFGAFHLTPQPDPTDLTRVLAGRPYDPTEVLVGLRKGLPWGFEVTAAVGKGITGGIGAPTIRGLLQVGRGWPADRGRLPSYYAIRDSDGDGLSDSDDTCPLEAEVVNGRADDDGCPEAGPEVFAWLAMEAAGSAGEAEDKPKPKAGEAAKPPPPVELEPLPELPPLTKRGDSDGDGVHDGDDNCPDVKEDIDEFEDDDGCPDPDDDRDGILDAVDQCRKVAESVNHFEDEDGCPDIGPDSDGDTIGDFEDVCPYEPENMNGKRDWDGCPEAHLPTLRKQLAALIAKPKPQAKAKAAPKPIARVKAALPKPVNLPPLTRKVDTDGDGLDDDVDECPDEPEDDDEFQPGDGCPDPDDDQDGILDADDACRYEAETFNDHEDEDGCPDLGPDSDGDGVGDYEDQCPREPETMDGKRDWDGCPEADLATLKAQIAIWEAPPVVDEPKAKPKPKPKPKAPKPEPPPPDLPPLEWLGDKDGDGLTALDDQCPDVPEDLDGLADLDGCPEEDLDSDRVADVNDKCPHEGEVYNGFEDEDGCPDAAPKEIEDVSGVVEKIRFKSGKADLRRTSLPTLRKVAKVMLEATGLELHIKGHTDSMGTKSANMRLSQARADSVRTWLINRGVPSDRLVAQGYGETQPISKARFGRGAAKNRRVELEYVMAEAPPPEIEEVERPERGEKAADGEGSTDEGESTDEEGSTDEEEPAKDEPAKEEPAEREPAEAAPTTAPSTEGKPAEDGKPTPDEAPPAEEAMPKGEKETR